MATAEVCSVSSEDSARMTWQAVQPFSAGLPTSSSSGSSRDFLKDVSAE